MKLLTALTTATCLLLFAGTASARDIVINGQTLNAQQIAMLDSAACTRVPAGRYWLLPNGAWGYEGWPVVAGFLGELCRAAAPDPTPRRKSLSERGLLYSPGEILR